MAAGLPSAIVFTQHIAQALRKQEPAYDVSPVGSAFAAVASDVEAFLTREFLLSEVARILVPPQGLQPTFAHGAAVRLFDLIMTTNWDLLFEHAAVAAKAPLHVVKSDCALPSSGPTLVKLHGSLDEPQGLLLTERDVLAMDRTHPLLWNAVREVIRDRPLIIVGTSLRDASVIRLFLEAQPRAQSYFVAPEIFAATRARLRAWNIECICSDADTFFERLTDALG